MSSAEDRLSSAAYRAIYQHSPDGVLFTAPDGRVFAANPAACALL
ncbi:MAG TPA: PAS domain-containing protein [Solirubrobacteraceae bacterium]|nr:PAS domain-containing protein [Solirubrobacteraceae bacterium]